MPIIMLFSIMWLYASDYDVFNAISLAGTLQCFIQNVYVLLIF